MDTGCRTARLSKRRAMFTSRVRVHAVFRDDGSNNFEFKTCQMKVLLATFYNVACPMPRDRQRHHGMSHRVTERNVGNAAVYLTLMWDGTFSAASR